MKSKNGFPVIDAPASASISNRGSALIIVVLVLAFLQVIGLVLLTVTATGPQVAGNIRAQQQASNIAETGFDVAWTQIEEVLGSGVWVNFEGHYLTEPAGIDLPQQANYFRKMTDAELLDLIDPDGDGLPNVATVLYFRQTFVQKRDGSPDDRFTYTVFLIDDEAGGGVSDPEDAILVCIGSVGRGTNMSSSRVEAELVIQLPGG
jgi:hypothetical protein